MGVSFRINNQEIDNVSKDIGFATNNIAEYTALYEALLKAQTLGYKHISVKADSELMIKQMKGEYKVKNPEIKEIFLKIVKLVQSFSKVEFKHVRREENKRADELANMALDMSS